MKTKIASSMSNQTRLHVLNATGASLMCYSNRDITLYNEWANSPLSQKPIPYGWVRNANGEPDKFIEVLIGFMNEHGLHWYPDTPRGVLVLERASFVVADRLVMEVRTLQQCEMRIAIPSLIAGSPHK